MADVKPIFVSESQKAKAEMHIEPRPLKYASLKQFVDNAINTQIDKDLNEEASQNDSDTEPAE